MPDDNPYAAPQAALEHSAESVVIEGELPFLADRMAFHGGAAEAERALGHGIALVLLSIVALVFLAIIALVFLWAFQSETPFLVFWVAVLVIAQSFCWRFYVGLSRMAAAARFFLHAPLAVAKTSFLVWWSNYSLKLTIFLFFAPRGELLFALCDLLDSLAGVVLTLGLGIAAFRLGRALQQQALRRTALLTMILLGGSCSLFLITDCDHFYKAMMPRKLGGVVGLVAGSNDSFYYLVVAVPALWFITGYISLMGLLGLLAKLPIRETVCRTLPPLADAIPDVETIERRRRMTEG